MLMNIKFYFIEILKLNDLTFWEKFKHEFLPELQGIEGPGYEIK